MTPIAPSPIIEPAIRPSSSTCGFTTRRAPAGRRVGRERARRARLRRRDPRPGRDGPTGPRPARSLVRDGQRRAHVLLDQHDRHAARAHAPERGEHLVDELRDSPADGSSSISTRGSTSSARAVASIWRCPPESLPAGLPDRSARSGNIANAASMRSARSERSRIALAHSTRFSRMLSVANTFSVCGTKASPRWISRWASRCSTRSPSSSTSPPCTGTSPATAFTNVDLPAPVRTEHGDEAAARQREVDPVDDRQPGLVAGDERAGLEHRVHAAAPPRNTSITRASPHDLGGRAVGERPPAGHDEHARAQPRDERHVVLDQEDRDAAGVDVDQALDDELHQRRVDAPRPARRAGSRAARPSARARAPAACAGRRRAPGRGGARAARGPAARAARARPRDRGALLARDPARREQVGERAVRRTARSAPVMTFSSTVIAGNGRGIWKVRPSPRARRRCAGSPVTVSPSTSTSPGVRAHAAREQPEQRALARPVRTDDAEDPAGRERHVDAVDGGGAAVAPGQAPTLQRRRRRAGVLRGFEGLRRRHARAVRV